MKKLDRLTQIISIFVAIILAFCVGLIFIQVVRRYVFGSVFRWAEEIARYLVVWVTFLGAVLCLKYGEHTRIEVFINLFPHKIKKSIEVFDYVMCLGFMMLLGYHSIQLLHINGAFRSAASNTPMYMVYSCILVSGILMIPYFAVLIYQKIKEPDPKAISVEKSAEQESEKGWDNK